MNLGEITVSFIGESDAFTPEFEVSFEEFEEKLDKLVESMRDSFGVNIKIEVDS